MKYKFTGKTKTVDGILLHQIEALVKIPGVVNCGDIGGWIENEWNLDHLGDAWISGDAQVYGNALVCGNARVYGDAQVYGNARVYGNALVYGNAQVCGDSRVYGNARVCGNARVYGNIDLCFFGGFGSQQRQTTAFVDLKIGIRVNCGCFSGTLKEFRAQVIKTHSKGSLHRKQYLAMAKMIAVQLTKEK